MLGTGSGTNARCQMVCVGTGLPPIPRRIVEKIQNHEFVEFTELPPAKGKSRVSPPQGDGQIVVVQAADLIQSRMVIPDLATWDAVIRDIRGSEGGSPATQTGRSDGVPVPNSEGQQNI